MRDLDNHAAVFRRGEARPRHSVTRSTASGPRPVRLSLRAAVERERERSWTPRETEDFLSTHRKLHSQLGPRWSARLDEILIQAQPLMALQPEHGHHRTAGRRHPEPDAQPEAGI